MSLATIGQPAASASTSGRPNPSVCEQVTSAVACRSAARTAGPGAEPTVRKPSAPARAVSAGGVVSGTGPGPPIQTNEHTSKQFDQELESLRARVLQMGGFVEQQVTLAIDALTTGDMELCANIVANDHKVNSMEVGIDEECSTIIARRQPAAGDLRLVMMVVKTITDLERIGDEAAKIARMAKLINSVDRVQQPRYVEIRRMANLALEMLRKSLDCFARLDVSGSAEVVRTDQHVDDEFRAILRQLITFMMEDPRTISASIEILFIAKALERIGDHAKNISEYVIYMVKGKDVRHVTLEEIEREIMA